MTQPDVVIVGCGPAGMSAAMVLARAGAAVLAVDEQPAPGGQVYRAVETAATRDAAAAVFGDDYVRGEGLTRGFRESGIETRFGTSVWDIAGGESPRIGLADDAQAALVNPRHIVLAGGAMERPTPFPGWTLPGVMGVGAAQTLLKESGLVPGGRVVIAGTGPLVLLYARQLLAAGARPDAILDTGPQGVPVELWPRLARALAADSSALFKGLAWQRELRRAGVRRLTRVESLRAHGSDRVESVEYVRNGQTFRLAADVLLVHDGVIPNTHLSMAAGCEHLWRELQRSWVPALGPGGASSVAGISIVGDGAGIAGAEAAACAGRVTGWHVAAGLGLVDEARRDAECRGDIERLRSIAVMRDFLDHQYRPLESMQVPPDDTVICRCEEITAGQVREVARMGCTGPNQGKAFTRCGMGPCMGRKCGNTVSQILADQHELPVPEIGHYRIRPPVRPLTVGQLADLE